VSEEKQKRRKPSGWPSIMSLALVMFILSLWGLSILAFDSVVKNIVEEANLDVYFNEGTSDEKVIEFIASQESLPEIKRVKYVSQQDGYKELMQDKSNEDMAEFVSPETLPKSVEIFFNVSEDLSKTMAQKAKDLQANPIIEDVVYKPNLVAQVTHNVRIAQYILLVACFIFVVIAIGLIQSSTRLSILRSDLS
jgi:cell division protein FtsX